MVKSINFVNDIQNVQPLTPSGFSEKTSMLQKLQTNIWSISLFNSLLTQIQMLSESDSGFKQLYATYSKLIQDSPTVYAAHLLASNLMNDPASTGLYSAIVSLLKECNDEEDKLVNAIVVDKALRRFISYANAASLFSAASNAYAMRMSDNTETAEQMSRNPLVFLDAGRNLMLLDGASLQLEDDTVSVSMHINAMYDVQAINTALDTAVKYSDLSKTIISFNTAFGVVTYNINTTELTLDGKVTAMPELLTVASNWYNLNKFNPQRSKAIKEHDLMLAAISQVNTYAQNIGIATNVYGLNTNHPFMHRWLIIVPNAYVVVDIRKTEFGNHADAVSIKSYDTVNDLLATIDNDNDKNFVLDILNDAMLAETYDAEVKASSTMPISQFNEQLKDKVTLLQAKVDELKAAGKFIDPEMVLTITKLNDLVAKTETDLATVVEMPTEELVTESVKEVLSNYNPLTFDELLAKSKQVMVNESANDDNDLVNESMNSAILTKLMTVDAFNKTCITNMATWDPKQGIAISEINDADLYKVDAKAPYGWGTLQNALSKAATSLTTHYGTRNIALEDMYVLVAEASTNKILAKLSYAGRSGYIAYETRGKMDKKALKEANLPDMLTSLGVASDIDLTLYCFTPKYLTKRIMLNYVAQSGTSLNEDVDAQIRNFVDAQQKQFNVTVAKTITDLVKQRIHDVTINNIYSTYTYFDEKALQITLILKLGDGKSNIDMDLGWDGTEVVSRRTSCNVYSLDAMIRMGTVAAFIKSDFAKEIESLNSKFESIVLKQNKLWDLQRLRKMKK